VKNAKAVLSLFFVIVVLLLIASSSSAQVPGPNITAFPQSLIFCKPPIPQPQGEGQIGVPGGNILSNALRLITLANQGTEPLVLEDIRLTAAGIVGSTARVHGIIKSDLPIATDAVIVERKNSAHSTETMRGFSAVTDCFDVGANALVLQPGGSCTVFLRPRIPSHTPEWPGRSIYVEVASNDPGRPILSVPVVVSQSPNCRPSPGINGVLGDVTGFTPFIDVLNDETPPQSIPPTADCNCVATCKSFHQTSGHVQCYSQNNCHDCCGSFANWYCDGGVSSISWSNF
jgi:hypothetical protein